jgi:3-hydroxymyristoyl/3-hydroxydecanoyl-(acyl carrier protein) dehydratase
MAAGSKEISFALDHPTAEGHFPGNPIIPGALLLDSVLRAVLGGIDAARPYQIRVVKFLRPVRPGDRIRIDWRGELGETHFRCTLVKTEELALTGTLRWSDERQ